MRHRVPLLVVLAALTAAGALVAADTAEAGGRRRARAFRHHKFRTALAPSKGRTPETDAYGKPAAASRDVAAGCVEGGGRAQVLADGASILLSPTRALVANAYRGLTVVDVSDPGAPTVLGSVAVDGSADRLFLDGATALVVSQTWTDAGGTTVVTAVDLSDEAHPEVVGSSTVDGSLSGATQSGGDLIVVTSTWSYGPWAEPGGYGMMDGARIDDGGMTSGGGMMDGGGMMGGGAYAMDSADPATGDGLYAPGFWFPWGGEAKARVARVTVGEDGAPGLAGTFETDGSLLAFDVDGDDVALAIDRTDWAAVYGSTDGTYTGPDLALFDVDASGAPEARGSASLTGFGGVTTLDLDQGVARLIGWGSDSSPNLATYSTGSGDPAKLGSFAFDAWPGATAFAGDRLVLASAPGYWTSDPIFDEDKDRADGGPLPSTAASVEVLDLSDPAHPTSLGKADVAQGSIAALQSTAHGVVATVSDPVADATHVVLLDVATGPAVAASVDPDGWWYPSALFDGLLVLSGGRVSDDGAWVPQILPVGIGDGSLTEGGTIDASTWAAASAWSDPILALAGIDSLELVDLSDLAHPVRRGSVRLAVNVSDLAVLGDDAAACLVTDYVGGTIEVRTVSLPDADALAPLDAADLGTGDGRLFRDGSFLYVLATDWRTGGARVTVVDAADPSDLRVRGTLDLGAYPGQAFLVNGALVLLRESWSLVGTNERTGKRFSKADPFGRCRLAWTEDELSAVLDVVDLSDPDHPRAAERRRIRWDWGGAAVLRGSTLYVPSYGGADRMLDGLEDYSYAVRAIDLSTPTAPRIGPLVTVPGSLVGAADEAGRVLTVSYAFDDVSYGFHATLHLVDLTEIDWRERVLASTELAGSPGAVSVGADHAYVASETWSAQDGSVSFALTTFDLDGLSETSTVERDRHAWDGVVTAGHLFLRSWGWTGSIDAYGLADPAAPVLAASTDVDGVGLSIGVAGGRAYVPAGYRGVHSFALE